MATLNEVGVDGVMHDLGVVKMFAQQPDIAKFIPDENRLAMSWVRLEAGQELAVHRHPEESLILICEGTGQTMGAAEQEVGAGDVILVPSDTWHGFRGTKQGFWALSIQFNGQALYEDTENPNAQFRSDLRTENSPTEQLLNGNDEHLERFSNSRLLKLIDEPAIHRAEVRERLLDCQQIWSDAFQDLLHLRVAMTADPRHKKVALDHLSEELGHNNNLRRQRGGDSRPVSDEQFESAMSWFKDEMLHGSDLVRTLLMHIVLEASGEIWHREAARVFRDIPHFHEHGEDDGDHVKMGLDLLSNASPGEIEDLRRTLGEGWKMITLLCDRIAVIAAPQGSGDARTSELASV
jgi:quercetin dioxygenase-like cupin family protein